jgi:uncharacterized protein YcnI
MKAVLKLSYFDFHGGRGEPARLALFHEKLDSPYDYYGKTVTEDVRDLVWSGGNLGDDYYDEFVFSTHLAGETGQTLYLKSIQECSEGSLRWVEIPAGGQDAHELEHPAPSLMLEAEQHQHQ